MTDAAGVAVLPPRRLRAPLPATGTIAIVLGLATGLVLGSAIAGPTVDRWGLPPASALTPAATPTPGGDSAFVIRVVELPATVDRAVLGNLNRLLKDIPATGGAVVVRVTGPSALPDDRRDLTDLDSIFNRRAMLAVEVALPAQPTPAGSPDLGTAGSLLLAIADHRFADPDESRAALSRNSRSAAPCAKECQKQVEGTATEHDAGMYATNDDVFLLAARPGQGSRVQTLGNLANPAPPTEDQPILPTWAYVMIAVVILAFGAVVLRGRRLPLPVGLRRRRRNGDAGDQSAGAARSAGVASGPIGVTGGRAEPRPVSRVAAPNVALGPVGTVHSAFDPQGYVAVDGGLYRATWMGGPGSPRPRVGNQVLLRMDEVDGLQAWPPQDHSGVRR